MAGNMSILPSRHRKIENSGHRVREIGRRASTRARRYDFREPGGYLGNVGFGDSRSSPKEVPCNQRRLPTFTMAVVRAILGAQ